MFGRKDAIDNTDTTTTDTASTAPGTPRTGAADAGRTLNTGASSQPRRSLELPHSGRSRTSSDRVSDSGERKLTVGKGLSVSGEITSCDVLVVEGKVEAKLTEGKLLEITETGQFRGSVEIENADIAGRYDGDLTVHGRLTVRSTGRISGMVKYGELEVNAGGQIIGEIQVVGGGQAASSNATSGRSFKSAAKFTAGNEEEEDDALFRKASA